MEFLTTFNVCGCSDNQRIWTCQNFDQKITFWFFMADFVKNGHFLGSRMTLFSKSTNKTHSQVIPDPQKWPFFTKSAIKNSNFYFLTKILKCPNSLDVRASTDVKRAQKFQLEPDQNPIRTWVEPDKSRCIHTKKIKVSYKVWREKFQFTVNV